MADDDLDLDLDDYPDRGGGSGASPGHGGSGRSGGGGRRWLWLLVGVALGVAASILVPRYVAPHLPAALGGGLITVDGEVLDKRRESGRLLLTLDSERGAMLATFRERVSELDLLVGRGDSVTLAMREFRPFVDGPRLVGVKKGAWKGRVPEAADTGDGAGVPPRPGPATDTSPPAAPDTPTAPDTAPSSGGGAADSVGAGGPGAPSADGLRRAAATAG